MTEVSFEKLVSERDFIAPLSTRAQILLRLCNTLLISAGRPWSKRHFFQLQSEADELESFLDDWGARYNRTYNYLTELVASVRGFALAGMSLEHLAHRIGAYDVLETLGSAGADEITKGLESAQSFVQDSLRRMFDSLFAECRRLGLEATAGSLPEEHLAGDGHVRHSLPRNVGTEELQDEEQHIADLASKYLSACSMLKEAEIRPMEDAGERERFLHSRCTEEHARVFEATVHNLQSAYDTYIKNTVQEASDERLPRLRGHVSSTLHLLEAVTQLTHFVERHESGHRSEAAEERLASVVDRDEVRRVTQNLLLHHANQLLQAGRSFAEQLLPAYTQVRSLEVEMSGSLSLHARPCSLIVAIVNRYGTPVEMEIAGKSCNAGSILEMMITVGSNPDEAHFTFRGDVNPLRDIGLLFEHDLGESGLDDLPDELRYLKP